VGILEISLLGGFQVHIDGLPLDPIPSRTARSLLAYLGINRDRTHTRDLLAGMFWPDLPDSEARRQLSRALWHIHACIDQGNEHRPRHVVTAGGAVRLNPKAAIQLDTERFQQLLREAQSDSVVDPLDEAQLLEAAVSLYKGDLLEGFYEDWALAARDAFRADYLQAVRRLCDLAAAKGDYEAALTHARLLTRHDPWEEDGHRRVMRLVVLVGRPNEAIRQYQTCCQTLKSELGAEPSKATRQLYEAVLRDREHARLDAVLLHELQHRLIEGLQRFDSRAGDGHRRRGQQRAAGHDEQKGQEPHERGKRHVVEEAAKLPEGHELE